MWLLNIWTRQLEAFEGVLPPYAVLSHRWDTHEVTFKDVQSGGANQKIGYDKIDGFRMLMQSHSSIRHVWIDTCCIDKSNSSELSEAINSMYQWYSGAEKCCVYLSDVSGEGESEFCQSQWFTRGWTLQELLAPRIVEFYDKDWIYLGNTESLRLRIVAASGLPGEVFDRSSTDGQFQPSTYSVADRMAWASRRETTRPEDRAYSLLGLFEVNMPLIYGEGERAFYRLQQEILRQYDDPSILAWRGPGFPGFEFMARSPSSFAREDASEWWDQPYLPAYVHQTRNSNRLKMHLPGTTITSAGINMDLMLIPYYRNTYLAPVCERRAHRNGVRSMANTLCIALRRSSKYGGFRRVVIDGNYLLSAAWYMFANAQTRTVLLERGPIELVEGPEQYGHSYQFDICDIDSSLVNSTVDVISRAPNDSNAAVLEMDADITGVAGVVRFQLEDGAFRYLLFGHDFDYSPFCLAMRSDRASGTGLARGESHETFYFPTIREAPFRLASNTDIMSLLTSMQDLGLESLPEHSLERHQMSWADTNSALFQVHKSMTVRLEPDGHLGYKVWIKARRSWSNLAADPPLNLDSLETSWCVRRWVGNSPEAQESEFSRRSSSSSKR